MSEAAALEFDPATHTYRLGQIIVPNVTRVIEWMNNYAGIPADVMERAREIGEAVHLATAMSDADDLDESSVPAEITGHLAAWRKFRLECQFNPSRIEYRVYSARGYAGTLDRAGQMAEKPALVDVKATAALPPSVGPQTAAYLAALIEQDGNAWKRARRFTVQLRADGTYRLEEHKDAGDLSVFLSSLNCYQWSQRWK